MNQKRAVIQEFIEKDLLRESEASFKEFAEFSVESKRAEVEKSRDRVEAAIGNHFTPSGDVEEGYRGLPIVQEYLKKQSELAKAMVTRSQIRDIFNLIVEFFSRYYDNGDFISRRRFGNKSAYSIPYNGEDTILYWANFDQYYVKTTEFFYNYAFKFGGGRVRFRVKPTETSESAEPVESPRNELNRYFVLAKKNPVEYDQKLNELTVWFQHRGLSDDEERKLGKTSTTIQTQLMREIPQVVEKVSFEFKASLLRKHGDEPSPLEQNLDRYVTRNTADFFIDKDLKTFLSREFDFFLKNEVVDLDELENKDSETIKILMAKVKVLRRIVGKIIEFLAQMEDFQKMLFEKRKFVIKKNYCLTLDKVPKQFYGEIIKNESQIAEWKDLFGFDLASQSSLFGGQGKKKFDPQVLESNMYLVLDTKHFSDEFKDKLIASFDNLDASIEGLVIKSENFQALNLLYSSLWRQVSCVYIDPPYNSQSTEILYKNNYKHSSWLTLMLNRLGIGKALLKEGGSLIVAIDENEQERLGMLLDGLFPGWNRTCVTIVHNPRGIQGRNFSYSSDFAYFVFPEESESIGDKAVPPEQWEYSNLRKWGGESTRETGRTVFYPIYVKDGKIVRLGEVPDEDFHPKKQNIPKKDGEIEVWPIDQNGIERKWRYAKPQLSEKLNATRVRQQNGGIEIEIAQTNEKFKTSWVDPLYDAGTYGTRLLTNMGLSNGFSFPKSLYTERDCLYAVVGQDRNALVLDFFAGSGTTAHAVMLLNQADHGSRKYVLCEIGDHFDTVLVPRIKKVMNSKEWKDGKPASSNGTSHMFAYMSLEQYEDSLENITFESRSPKAQKTLEALEDYTLKYMLDYESRSSPTRLDIERFAQPFDYKLRLSGGEYTPVDLVETFNYLLGLKVSRAVPFAYKNLKCRAIFGTNSAGRVAVVWRSFTAGQEKGGESSVRSEEGFRDFVLKEILNPTQWDKVYVNGDSLIPKAEALEPEFKRLMSAR